MIQKEPRRQRKEAKRRKKNDNKITTKVIISFCVLYVPSGKEQERENSTNPIPPSMKIIFFYCEPASFSHWTDWKRIEKGEIKAEKNEERKLTKTIL